LIAGIFGSFRFRHLLFGYPQSFSNREAFQRFDDIPSRVY
jgi:hypothetical protein